jgi:hypothetical protein
VPHMACAGDQLRLKTRCSGARRQGGAAAARSPLPSSFTGTCVLLLMLLLAVALPRLVATMARSACISQMSAWFAYGAATLCMHMCCCIAAVHTAGGMQALICSL